MKENEAQCDNNKPTQKVSAGSLVIYAGLYVGTMRETEPDNCNECSWKFWIHWQ